VTVERWCERVWAAHPALLVLGATGSAPGRATWRSGAMTGADLGVPHAWGVQVTAGAVEPDVAEAAAALGWCHERGGEEGWLVSVPESLVGAASWGGLLLAGRTGVFATDAPTAATMDAPAPGGVELELGASRDDVVAGYGGWMNDLPLARLLVTEEDLARSDRRFLVARLNGRVVGSAFVWWAEDTGYLSGIGVVEGLRGRGIGRALTGRAAYIAALGHDGAAPDVVWMHATFDGAALYSRMGFTLVDTEVRLGPG
jgi:ribosomal protein S18 acetylase RimI-like enzyme